MARYNSWLSLLPLSDCHLVLSQVLFPWERIWVFCLTGHLDTPSMSLALVRRSQRVGRGWQEGYIHEGNHATAGLQREPLCLQVLIWGTEKSEGLLCDSWAPCTSPPCDLSCSRLFTTELRTFLSSSAEISMSSGGREESHGSQGEQLKSRSIAKQSPLSTFVTSLLVLFYKGSWGYVRQAEAQILRPWLFPVVGSHSHPADVSVEAQGPGDLVLCRTQVRSCGPPGLEVLTSPAICLKMLRNCCCSSLSWSVLPGGGCGSTKENWFTGIRDE